MTAWSPGTSQQMSCRSLNSRPLWRASQCSISSQTSLDTWAPVLRCGRRHEASINHKDSDEMFPEESCCMVWRKLIGDTGVDLSFFVRWKQFPPQSQAFDTKWAKNRETSLELLFFNLISSGKFSLESRREKIVRYLLDCQLNDKCQSG